MKRLLSAILAVALMAVAGCKGYDDTELRNLVGDYESRISDLETRVSVLESTSRDLSAYQSLLQKLGNGKTVTGYSEADGVITLVFSDNSSVEFNQKGEKGDPGEPGNPGDPGTPGENGVTPRFRINEESLNWEVSYDEGNNWTAVGSALDRSLISDIEIDNDEYTITIILADGTPLVVPCNDCGEPGSRLRMPRIFRDNMVLQQKTDANIWGWAEAGSTVKVSVSWSPYQYKTVAGQDGFWILSVTTPMASFTPQWVEISCGGDSLLLENILIGEVWLCSGQSNMDMPMAGWSGQPVENSEEDMLEARHYPGLRMLMIQKETATSPKEDARGEWWTTQGNEISKFSALAYYFGRELSRQMNVPVGLIVPCWSGSRIECWMGKESLMKAGLSEEYIDLDIQNNHQWTPAATCTVMYNAMIYPLRHYAINGFIWYQGCSNVNLVSSQDYAQYQAAMVSQWRADFERGNIPFYYVQIAPFAYAGSLDSYFAPRLRDRQKAAASLVANSAMVATCDLTYEFERTIIHPRRKAEVGQRLANLALEHWYKFDVHGSDSPDVKSVQLQGAAATIVMTNCEDGVHTTDGTDLQSVVGFEVAGSDQVWHPAHITSASGNALTVASDLVSDVKYVRYLWHDFQIGYLWNSYGLPLLPFTTE